MPVGRRYHLGLSGLLYVGVTMLLGLGAVNSQNNLLFLAFGVAIGGMIVSGLLSGSMLMGVRAEREEIVTASAGEAMAVRYAVTNRNRIVPAFALTVSEVPRRGWFGGRSAATWPRHVGALQAAVGHVGAGQTVRVDAAAAAFRRGEPVFEYFRVTTSFPFGIVKKSVLFRARATGMVRPEIAVIDREIAVRASGRRESDLADEARVGRGSDYLGLRAYVVGDSQRQIAWRASARTGDLVVREQTRPSSPRVWIGLDLIAPGAHESAREERERDEANERAISLAAGLIEENAKAGVSVGLLAPAAGVKRAPAEAGRSWPAGARTRAVHLLDDLARLDVSIASDAPAPVRVDEGTVVVVCAGREMSAVWPERAERVGTEDVVMAAGALAGEDA